MAQMSPLSTWMFIPVIGSFLGPQRGQWDKRLPWKLLHIPGNMGSPNVSAFDLDVHPSDWFISGASTGSMGQALAMKTTSHSWQYGKEMVAPSCHIKFLWLLSCESKWIDDIDAVWNQGFRLWGGFNIRLWTLGYTVYHGIPLKDPYMISYSSFQ